jgi:lipopolysaccharide export system protein LptA
MKYDTHKIESDSLDLYFNKNLVTISGNVIYNSLNTKMKSDKVEFDLITKNFKIFMNDKKKLVKIKNTD